MNFRWTSRSMLVALVLVLGMGLLFAGCGKKAPVETDTTVPVDETPVTPVEDNTPVPEPDPEPVEDPGPDYSSLSPSEYGVEDVFFAFDKYDLDGEAMSILSKNARILREADVLILISGHCDERGTVEYNLALGEKRANAVRDYLVSLGVPSRNLRVTSYGESAPFARGHSENDWALNRRAHFERP
jgi:peptidoglycan-associated lipoprotein